MNPFLICTPYGFTFYICTPCIFTFHICISYICTCYVFTYLLFSTSLFSALLPLLSSSLLLSPLLSSPLLFSLCSFRHLFFFFFVFFFFLLLLSSSSSFSSSSSSSSSLFSSSSSSFSSSSSSSSSSFFFFYLLLLRLLLLLLFSLFSSLFSFLSPATFHYLLRPAAEARKITKCNSLARKEVRSKEKMGFVIFAVPRSGPRAWYEDLVVAALQVAKTRDVMCYLAKGATSIIPSFGGSCVAKIAAFTPLAFAPTSFCTTVTSFYTDQLSHQPACTMSELRSKVPAASGLPKWAGGTCWRMWNTLMKTNLKAGTT